MQNGQVQKPGSQAMSRLSQNERNMGMTVNQGMEAFKSFFKLNNFEIFLLARSHFVLHTLS